MNKNIYTFLLLLAVAGCSKELAESEATPAEAGKRNTNVVQLTGLISHPTKVSFDDVGKFSWTEDDPIALCLNDGTNGSYTTVYATSLTQEKDRCTVNVEIPEGVTRNYYAVYPAGIVDPENYGNPTLKVILPSEYTVPDAIDGMGEWSPTPMIAINEDEGSSLSFTHIGGLLRITLNGVKSGTTGVKVVFDKDVTGSYTVNNPSASNPTITTAGTAENNVVEFTGISATDMIVLNVPVPCGSYEWVRVETYNGAEMTASQTYDERPLTFSRQYGKRISFGELAFDFVFGTLSDAEISYEGGTGTLSSDFVSYKTDGIDSEPIPFTLEYSEDGGTTWTTTAPSWLAPGTIDLDGSTDGQSMELTATAQTGVAVDEHHDELAKSSRARTNFDLSTFNVSTTKWEDNLANAIPRTTANCYVVQGAGTYRFPLVYGNGVVNNAINQDAYRGRNNNGNYLNDAGLITNTSSNIGFLGSFKDHLDQNIYDSENAATSSPYLTTHLNRSAADFSAILVWQDEPGLVSVDAAISGSGEDSYVTFSVPSETITQGNALIAVLLDGVIAWSWHIWVTEEDLSDVKALPSGFKISPVNLGWCEGKKANYAPRSCMVRATQSGSDNATMATLTQAEGTAQPAGNNPYYQWGRKDPLQASDGIAHPAPNTTFKTYYYSSEAYTTTYVLQRVSIGTAIQTPYVQYKYKGNQTNLNDWNDTMYHNRWNTGLYAAGASNFSTGIEVTKTIYDPSPVGYKVPHPDAFQGLSTSNCVTETLNGSRGRIYNNELFFPFVGNRWFWNSDGNYNFILRLDNINYSAKYYTATPSSSAASGSFVYFFLINNDIFVKCDNKNPRENGEPVRPIQDVTLP